MKILKQVLGVDVAQKELVVTLGRLNEDLSCDLYSYGVFKNEQKGLDTLLKWLNNNVNPAIPTRIVMEATGVYHQKLAHFMLENQFQVSVVLPNKVSNYMRTLEIKTVTDKTCSEAIARFGLERKLEDWNKPDDTYYTIKQLTRERDQIVDDRTGLKNRLHAEQSEFNPNQNTIKRINDNIAFLNQQEKQIKKEINDILKLNTQIKEKVDIMATIPGMGKLIAVIILAETNGFELIRNKKQLTSYAGLDVKEKSSGTSVRSKKKISKKGNRHIRKSLYMPSLCGVRFNPIHKEVYARLVSNHGIKMKSLIAIQRKMLELSYVLVKNNTRFDPIYEQKKGATKNVSSLCN